MSENKKEKLLKNSVTKDKKIIDWISNINKEIKEKAIQTVTNYKIISTKDKGIIGKKIEELFFGIKNNNRNEADLKELGIEIKVTGMKLNENGILVAKERLKFSSINYKNLVLESDFLNSSFFAKNRNLLIIFYKYEKNKSWNKFKILQAKLIDLLTLKEITQIESDYLLITKKVLEGKAHEISGSDTKILEACTSGKDSSQVMTQPNSDVKAKTRSFAFKNAFLTKLYYRSFDYNFSNDYHTYFDVINKIKMYQNKSINELNDIFNYRNNSKSNRFPLILKILEVKDACKIKPLIEENIIIKTICLNSKNKLKEEIQLSKITLDDMDKETNFIDTEFYDVVANKKIIFIIFKEINKKTKEIVLHDVVFFEFDKSDIKFAEDVYNHTKNIFNNGKAIKDFNSKKNKYNFIRISDEKRFHVRPKARDSNDCYPTHFGEKIPKQCFWFNKSEFYKRVINKN